MQNENTVLKQQVSKLTSELNVTKQQLEIKDRELYQQMKELNQLRQQNAVNQLSMQQSATLTTASANASSSVQSATEQLVTAEQKVLFAQPYRKIKESTMLKLLSEHKLMFTGWEKFANGLGLGNQIAEIQSNSTLYQTTYSRYHALIGKLYSQRDGSKFSVNDFIEALTHAHDAEKLKPFVNALEDKLQPRKR